MYVCSVSKAIFVCIITYVHACLGLYALSLITRACSPICVRDVDAKDRGECVVSLTLNLALSLLLALSLTLNLTLSPTFTSPSPTPNSKSDMCCRQDRNRNRRQHHNRNRRQHHSRKPPP